MFNDLNINLRIDAENEALIIELLHEDSGELIDMTGITRAQLQAFLDGQPVVPVHLNDDDEDGRQ